MPRSAPVPALILVLALGACNQVTAVSEEVGLTGEGDACGAAAYQSFVGQRVDALNDVELPEGSRVLFPTTPATMDFNPQRLNITIGSTDQIERAYCG